MHECKIFKYGDLFRLMDCEKMIEKSHFYYICPCSFRKSTLFFGEMGNEEIMSFWSYLFPMCLLRKTFFSYSSMLYFDSLKDFDFVS